MSRTIKNTVAKDSLTVRGSRIIQKANDHDQIKQRMLLAFHVNRFVAGFGILGDGIKIGTVTVIRLDIVDVCIILCLIFLPYVRHI